MGCGAKYDKIDRDSQIVLLSRLYQQVFDIFIDLSLNPEGLNASKWH